MVNPGVNLKSLGDCDVCFWLCLFIVKLYNTWQKKKRKPGILPSFDTDASLFGE